jgi:hypothetical protein
MYVHIMYILYCLYVHTPTHTYIYFIYLSLYSGTCGPAALTHCVSVNNGTSKMPPLFQLRHLLRERVPLPTRSIGKGVLSHISSTTHSFHLQLMVASTMVHTSRHSWDRRPTHCIQMYVDCT